MTKKRTHEEYVAEVAAINPDIEVIGKYVNRGTKILHKCMVCGYGSDNEWSPTPDRILSNHGCPKCANKINGNRLRKSHEQYVKELKKVNPNVEIIDKYTKTSAKTKHKCNVCGYGSNGNWTPQPSNLLRGSTCPVCAGKYIGDAPEYRNSIWASDNKNHYARYMTEEQMKSYTPSSTKKINMICPDCGKTKRVAPHILSYAGLGCPCGDGQSYPNKFIYSMLNQLSIEYIIEYSPDWAEKKRYDIYIPTLNCIIENHGKQHYVEQTGVFDKLEETQNNDIYKKQLALNNNIEHYIVLDCRNSDANWIRDSISNSELLNLLCINLTDIDWNKCNEYALKNMVKTASELWNKGLSVTEIQKKLSISHSATFSYLQKGKKAGWCHYDGKEAHKRNHDVYVERLKKWHSKPVYCFELNKYYDSMAEAGRDIGTRSSNVKACCDGKNYTVKGYHFCYADKIDEAKQKISEAYKARGKKKANNKRITK